MAGGSDGVQPVENPDEADPDASIGTYVVNEVHIDELCIRIPNRIA